MKKALVVLVALMFLSAFAAFADMPTVTYSGELKTGATVTLDSVADPAFRPWDNDDGVATRATFKVAAVMGDYSLHFYARSDFGTASPLAPAVSIPNAWVSAMWFSGMLTLNVGATDSSTTDTIDQGFGGINTMGAQLLIKPIDGLWIGVALPVALGGQYPIVADDLTKSFKIGAKYVMADVADVRLTYDANHGTVQFPVGTDVSAVSFGVSVLAIPNLTLMFEMIDDQLGSDTVGLIDLWEKVGYAMAPLTFGVKSEQYMYNDSTKELAVDITPFIEYAMMSDLAIGTTVTYTLNSGGTKDLSALSFDPYATFTWNANAKLKIDANFQIGDLTDTGTWTCPININFMYSF